MKDFLWACLILKTGNDLERLILYLEVHERLFMGLFDLKKTQDKKNANF